MVLAVSYAGTGAAAERPEWAFFVPAPGSKQIETPAQDAGATRWSPAGSTKSYTLAQLQDAMEPPDWYSDEHPSMPRIVAHGIGRAGEPALLPCALCHLPNGAGHVESASLAGLNANYSRDLGISPRLR
jgi:hypothetical protein